MGIASIGGFLMIMGAWFVYRGEIFKSVFIYLIADVIWMVLGFLSGDYIGTFLIFIGASLGLLAFVKMNKGEFNKTIRKEK